MAKQKRQDLRSNFRTGDRPTQTDFENVFDSFLNFKDDNLQIDENKNLKIQGSITLESNSQEPETAGTIRWNGTEFQGYDGEKWGALGGGTSAWDKAADNIVYTAGNVGIGDVASLSDKFEVELAKAERVRLGNSALGNGKGLALRNCAVFSHTKRREDGEYALVQNPNGKVILNCKSDQTLQFAVGNNTRAALDGDAFVIGNRQVISTEPTFLLQVDGSGMINDTLVLGDNKLLSSDTSYKLQINGSAFKNAGNDVFNTPSDIRVKKDIIVFSDGMNQLRKLEPVQFTYNGKGNTIDGERAIGFIAQDLQEVYPHMVQSMKLSPAEAMPQENETSKEPVMHEMLTTNLSALKFVMLNAIKELDQRLQKLEQVEQTKN